MEVPPLLKKLSKIYTFMYDHQKAKIRAEALDEAKSAMPHAKAVVKGEPARRISIVSELLEEKEKVEVPKV